MQSDWDQKLLLCFYVTTFLPLCLKKRKKQEQIYNHHSAPKYFAFRSDVLKQCDSAKLILYSNAHNLDVL